MADGARLLKQHCSRDATRLAADAADTLLQQVHADWNRDERAQQISRVFRFDNYYQTMAFVNALAWVAHREDHHPDLEVGYNRCVVNFSTHSVGGLSNNDFICAARIDALVDETA
jgi:4a-hydroxytetrahydrobiopterin dehydratase